MRVKQISLFSGTEKDWFWYTRCLVKENGLLGDHGTIQSYNRKERYIRDNEKEKIRAVDRLWVYRNIPSSIHWHTEIHHEWCDAGRMYLLTKEEHILLHRKSVSR